MTEELKPCPFCGGKAQILQLGGEHFGDQNRVVIQCAECKVITRNFYPSGKYHDTETGERAINSWNRRTSGWQPIETAPKDGRSVLVAGKSGGVFICKWDGYEERWQVVHDIEDYVYCEGILDVLCPARDLCLNHEPTEIKP